MSDKFVNVLLEVIVLLAQRALEAEKADLNRRVADAKMTGAEAEAKNERVND